MFFHSFSSPYPAPTPPPTPFACTNYLPPQSLTVISLYSETFLSGLPQGNRIYLKNCLFLSKMSFLGLFLANFYPSEDNTTATTVLLQSKYIAIPFSQQLLTKRTHWKSFSDQKSEKNNFFPFFHPPSCMHQLLLNSATCQSSIFCTLLA